MTYKDNIELECTCVDISIDKWEELMEGAVKANKVKINLMVKNQLPELYKSLALDCYNPYSYYRTDTHYILVHSAIEHFLKRSC